MVVKRRGVLVKVIQAAALTVGVALLVLGVLHGEPGEIMRKGTVVCLECIEIG